MAIDPTLEMIRLYAKRLNPLIVDTAPLIK